MNMAPMDNPGLELRNEAREMIQQLGRIQYLPMTAYYTKPITTIAQGVNLCLKLLIDLHEKEFGKAPKEENG